MGADIAQLNEMVKEESTFITLLRNELGKVIVGQPKMIDRLLIGLLTRGHILLEGVPGWPRHWHLHACQSNRYRF